MHQHEREYKTPYNPAIETIGLLKSYRLADQEIPILHGLDLTINRGEFVAIMGPSGSGKSTLMNMLGCLDRPTMGEVRIDNRNISELSDSEIAKLRGLEIGFVFQNFNLISRMNALENVLLPTYENSKDNVEPEKRGIELLELVGLGNRMDHKPSEMSGGQCQRVAIARSLINSPSIILADEPTGNLDSKTSLEIMKLFSKLHRQGSTVIMITHDPETAEYASRTIHLKDGYIENN
ncbi:ABC transporter ATP-binding protein [Methanohalophilus halophilus]|uniref:ABC transporter ATP-binding protein n=1 Tax=Methanohalophilus halophilus TaxID=2177 RepID=A0A1L3Q4B8_9EURY|nr:ABC transporter ATP-binding protein [Methanohalophilus halophilus]APH39673.1 ABC transporter ATP-binding protein [Methanohalophilus halophilus]RNI08992.1 ABC transporter ATP-binding protein [Methanohalophilus halophilus]SDW35352.1 putative ABC transport system ATP-binding protein [Methanohalophilus halophilus]